MCQLCITKPVYEFTNQQKLCKTCFIRWFNKKVLYTIRKFEMIKKKDIIGYHLKKDFRNVVLEDVLKMYSQKGTIELVKLPSNKKINKIAIPSTINSESEKIIDNIVKGKIKNLKDIQPQNKKIIKPLYLFLDNEVLLYAKLKNLKFNKIKETKKDKLQNFVDNLEKKHPELKRAVVKGFLELNN